MRDAPRLHVLAELEPGATVRLDADRAHYLVHVMRGGPGDPVRLFNATSGEWRARITETGKRGVALEVEQRTRPPAPRGFAPTLIFAPLKRDATDTVVRMATELGAARIVPVLTERTVATRVNAERLALIAREAAEQCERLDLPAIAPPVGLAPLLESWDPAVPIAAAIERAGAPPPAQAGAVMIGPEGGWARGELDLVLRAAFVHPVSLGALVLRADTAAAAALAVLGAAQGWAQARNG